MYGMSDVPSVEQGFALVKKKLRKKIELAKKVKASEQYVLGLEEALSTVDEADKEL